MVYCGKPSRGCQMCRTRRIKCDETKPTCNQCAKSRRQCPGYKDDFDLVFRNETQATERRARRATNGKKVSAQITFANQQSAFATDVQNYGNSESQALILHHSDIATQFSPPEMITIPYEQQAPCFFVKNYVLSPQQSSRGYFDFIEPMLEKESPDSHLSLAFAAVSMASLANRPNSRGRQLYPQAVGAYTKALKAVNIALQNPALQKTDSTLAAILMLGFFETIASERTSAMAWYSHIDGAVQLVRMRGKKQRRTKIGNSLFICVRAQMTTVCLSGSKAPPQSVDWWMGEQKEDAGSFITRLNLQIATLRCEINAALSTFPRTPEYFQQVLDLMKRAQAMEQEYLEWEARVPEEWRPRTVAWVDQTPGGDITKAEVCPGKVDTYPDLWAAQLWNLARVARLFISGVILRCAAWICSPVDYRTTPEYAQAVRLCGDLVTDIIASVPFFLGWNIRHAGNLKSGDFSGFDSWGRSGPPKAIGGFFVIWPLFSITNTDFVCDSHRAWAKGRMMYISEALGLNHAKVLSKFQVRLPSMIIRRDALVHTPPSTQMMAATMSRGYTPPVAANTSTHITTTTINQIAAQHAQSQPQPQQISPQFQTSSSPSYAPSTGSPSSTINVPIYTMNPLQQREAMQRETWEKERKNLLKKASNSQGDSVERLLANYLQV